MKKHSLVSSVVAVCLAGFIGQLAASGATTNSVWNLSSISVFKAGKVNEAITNTATAVFMSDGTASIHFKGHEYAGTYTNTTKLLTFSFGDVGIATLKSDVAALLESADPSVTWTVKSVKFSPKIKLSTTGVPETLKDTVKGKGCEGTTCKSFSLKTAWTNWVLTSGTNF